MGKLMNILPISDLRQDAAKVLKKLRDNKELVIITHFFIKSKAILFG